VLLRLFSLFENAISSICLKLACGARYIDGTAPNLTSRACSVQTARTLFQRHGRLRPRHVLKWSTAAEIKENLRYIIDINDNIVVVVDRNGSLIDELRRVRNRIAHNNPQSRKNYRDIVRSYYGAFLNNVTPGILLITQRLTPSLLERYIKKQRIFMKDAARA